MLQKIPQHTPVKFGILFLAFTVVTTACILDPLTDLSRSKDIDPQSPSYQGFHTVPGVDDILPHTPNGTELLYQEFMVSQVEEAEAYRLEIAEDEAFTNVVHHQDSFTGNSLVAAVNLEAEQLYYWRGSALSNEQWGRWTEPRSFTMRPPVAVVQEDSATTLFALRIDLSWDDVPDAASYEVQLDPAVGTRRQFAPTEAAVSVSTDINPADRFTWRVRAVREDGSATAWSSDTDVQIARVASVSAGAFHTVALHTDGSVWVTGENDMGQLGLGDTTRRSAFTQVAGISNAVSVSAGASHTVIITDDGTAWVTGSANQGRLGLDTADDDFITTFTALDSASNYTAAAAGDMHTLFLRENGTMHVTGRNYRGQLGTGNTTGRDVPTSVSLPFGMARPVHISAGGEHSLIVTEDNELWATGDRRSGQLGDGSTSLELVRFARVKTGVVAVAAGTSHTMALTEGGFLWGTGNNGSGRIGDGTSTSTGGVLVPVFDQVRAVTAGHEHSMLIRDDHTLWAMGRNSLGQLGDGTTTSRDRPVRITDEARAVSAGREHTVVLSTTGEVWVTGRNTEGQLGLSSSTRRTSLVRISW